MPLEQPVRVAIAAIYCLYYVALAIALPMQESWILVCLCISHLLVGAASATLDTDGPIAASRARYSLSRTGHAALAAIAADTLLFVSMITSLVHALQEHGPSYLFYIGWVAALCGNTACILTHWVSGTPYSNTHALLLQPDLLPPDFNILSGI